MRWLLRNWQLKIGAFALAMVLYTGLVYSGSFAEDTMRGVPLRGVDQPNVLVNIGSPFRTVDVRYRVSRDQPRPTIDTFSATIDLSKYDTARPGEPQLLPVHVSSLNDAVTVLSFSPLEMSVTLDTLDTRMVPVVVDRGSVPNGLEIGTPLATPSEVLAKGASSRLSQVVRAVAHVSIDASGISVDRQFDLTPVDLDGQRVDSVELSPNSAMIQIKVSTVQTNKTVPVRPELQGGAADGWVISAVQVQPATVTVLGAPGALGSIVEVSTQPIDLNTPNRTSTFTSALVVPAGATLAPGTPASVTVTVKVEPATGTRTFLTGLVCRGAPAGSACLPSLDQVAVTLSGPLATLDGLAAVDVTPVLNVSGLAPGTHDVKPTVSLPAGISLLSISPATVRVTIQPPASPSPSSSP